MTDNVNGNDTDKDGRATRTVWVFNLILVLAIAAALFGLWWSNKNGRTDLALKRGSVLGTSTVDPNYLIAMTDNLKNKGFVLYGDKKDNQTQKQLEIFGQAADDLDYVECDSAVSGNNAQECVAKGITKYPTWVLAETKIEGYKSLPELEKMLVNISF